MLIGLDFSAAPGSVKPATVCLSCEASSESLDIAAAVAVVAGLTWPYWVSLVVMAALLIYEHSLVRPDDLSKLNIAFFNINGYISVAVFAGTFAAVLVAG